MRKNKESKKGHETIIGKIIYGVLLFAPLLAIAVTSLYAIFNKNAYINYGDKYIENLTQVTTTSMLIENSNYQVVYNANLTNPGNQVYTVNKTSLDNYIEKQPTQYIVNITFLNDNGTPRIQYVLNDGTIARIMNWQNVCPTFVLNLSSNANSYLNTNFASLYLITETERSLSDVYYYAIDKVESNNLFNWSKETGMYQAVKTTAEGLGITNTFTPMLLTYWFMISIIYFIYDIGLMLIMIVHRKIHELQESV